MAFEKQLQVLLKDRKNSCRTTDSKLQKCSEFQGWRFARSHEFVGTISGATSRSPKRWGTRGWAWAPTATSYAYARCVNETTYLVSCPKKTDLPPTKNPQTSTFMMMFGDFIQKSMILFGDSDPLGWWWYLWFWSIFHGRFCPSQLTRWVQCEAPVG